MSQPLTAVKVGSYANVSALKADYQEFNRSIAYFHEMVTMLALVFPEDNKIQHLDTDAMSIQEKIWHMKIMVRAAGRALKRDESTATWQPFFRRIIEAFEGSDLSYEEAIERLSSTTGAKADAAQ